jgi:hypothetical protein
MLYIGIREKGKRPYVYKISEAMYAIDETMPGQALNPRFDLRNHNRSGFDWGYNGLGCAQLALAICTDHLQDDKLALKIYQQFKREVIATQPMEGFILADIYVDMKIHDILNGMQGD